jgi:hypothetical protein
MSTTSRVQAWRQRVREQWIDRAPNAKNKCLTCRGEIKVGLVSCSHCRQWRRRQLRRSA